jgi:hypothetical protein
MEGQPLTKPKFQIHSFLVERAKQSVPGDFNSTIDFHEFTGLMVVSTEKADSNSYFRKFSINDEEIFPEGFSVQLIGNRNAVSINDVFYKISEKISNSKIKFEYVDDSDPAGFKPYKVQFYFRALQYVRR